MFYSQKACHLPNDPACCQLGLAQGLAPRPWCSWERLAALEGPGEQREYSCYSDCFLFQGAAEDPQMALALKFDPALIKKSHAEGPRLLFPESELSIRIGRAGLLSGKLPAADPGLGPGGGGMTRELPGALSCPSERPTPLGTGQSWCRAWAFPSHVSSNPPAWCTGGNSLFRSIVFPTGTLDQDPSVGLGGFGLEWLGLCPSISLSPTDPECSCPGT